MQELVFRLIDYFLDKFIWALVNSDPYIVEKKPERIHQDFEEDIALLEKINEITTETITLV